MPASAGGTARYGMRTIPDVILAIVRPAPVVQVLTRVVVPVAIPVTYLLARRTHAEKRLGHDPVHGILSYTRGGGRTPSGRRLWEQSSELTRPTAVYRRVWPGVLCLARPVRPGWGNAEQRTDLSFAPERHQPADPASSARSRMVADAPAVDIPHPSRSSPPVWRPHVQVTLPSGHTAEIRDQFLRGDRRAAHKAAQFTIGPDGERVMDMSFEDAVYGALIRQMVVSWTIPQPAPREAQTAELAENIIDGLPDDDYAALADALKPFFDRVMRTGKEQDGEAPKPGSTGTSSSDAALDGQVTPSGSPTLS